MRVPHEKLTQPEVEEKTLHWAGILLGKPIEYNTAGPDWLLVRRRMEEARWLGHDEGVDAAVNAMALRQQVAVAERETVEIALSEGRVFDVAYLPKSCEALGRTICDGQFMYRGVVTTPEFWLVYGVSCYQHALREMERGDPAQWRGVARRVWENLSEEQRREVACQ